MFKVLTEEPGCCQIALLDVDWRRFLKSNAGLQRTLRLFHIRSNVNISDSQNSSTQPNKIESLAQMILLEKIGERREDLIKEYVSVTMTEWIGSSPSGTDLNTSLYNYGVHSTAALTLKMQLEMNLQVSFEVHFNSYNI